MKRALERAVELAGGQAEFARRLNLAREQLQAQETETLPQGKPIKQQHVHYWLTVMGKLPPEIVRMAEHATDGRITRYDFRSDVFGPPPGGAQMEIQLAG